MKMCKSVSDVRETLTRLGYSEDEITWTVEKWKAGEIDLSMSPEKRSRDSDFDGGLADAILVG